jgi:hypothetical protein
VNLILFVSADKTHKSIGQIVTLFLLQAEIAELGNFRFFPRGKSFYLKKQIKLKTNMNKNYTIPIIKAGAAFAPIAPVIFIGGAAIALTAWLLSDDKKAETETEKPENPNNESKLTAKPQKPIIPSLLPKNDFIILNTLPSMPTVKTNTKRPVSHLTRFRGFLFHYFSFRYISAM